MFLAEDIEIGQRRGAGERIPGVAVTMKEGLRFFIGAEKGLIDFLGCQGGCKRHVAAGETFANCE